MEPKSEVTMLRKLAAVAALMICTLLAGSGKATHADSLMPNVRVAGSDQYAHHYYVYYWCHGSWESYGCYSCPLQAQSAASSLQRLGYQTQIVCKYSS
jgi:hypothetical protein